MTYYIAKTVSGGFDDVIARVTEALKAEGFGSPISMSLRP